MSSINPTSFISYGIFQMGYRINYKLEDLFEQRARTSKAQKNFIWNKNIFCFKDVGLICLVLKIVICICCLGSVTLVIFVHAAFLLAVTKV